MLERALSLIFMAGMCLFSGYFGYRAWFFPNEMLEWIHKTYPYTKNVDAPGCWINYPRFVLSVVFILSVIMLANLVIHLFYGTWR